MGYTNKTSHYDLPQWIAGDKPSWLGDVNTAMLNIDTAIAGADASASAAESSAAAANAQVQAQEAKITKNTTDIQALTEQLANVSGVANAALPKNGGTMTGALMLSGEPTQDLQAATKKYVDDKSASTVIFTSTLTSLNYAFYACAVGNTLIFSCFGNNTTGLTDGTVVAKATGNVFDLTANQNYEKGKAFTTITDGSPLLGGIVIKFDGTDTTISIGGPLSTKTGAFTGSWIGAVK